MTTPTMPDLNEGLTRIDAVEARLGDVAMPAAGLTDADPATGEQWEAGQVWGHIAEFIQFWVEQAGDVIDAYQGEPVPFGRTRTDAGRLAGIEQGHRVAIDVLWDDVQADLGDLRSFLHALPDDWQNAVGLHPTLGSMPVEHIIGQFVIDHLEEHADQLEGLAGSSG